jgi:hypothetical protein
MIPNLAPVPWVPVDRTPPSVKSDTLPRLLIANPCSASACRDMRTCETTALADTLKAVHLVQPFQAYPGLTHDHGLLHVHRHDAAKMAQAHSDTGRAENVRRRMSLTEHLDGNGICTRKFENLYARKASSSSSATTNDHATHTIHASTCRADRPGGSRRRWSARRRAPACRQTCAPSSRTGVRVRPTLAPTPTPMRQRAFARRCLPGCRR